MRVDAEVQDNRILYPLDPAAHHDVSPAGQCRRSCGMWSPSR